MYQDGLKLRQDSGVLCLSHNRIQSAFCNSKSANLLFPKGKPQLEIFKNIMDHNDPLFIFIVLKNIYYRFIVKEERHFPKCKSEMRFSINDNITLSLLQFESFTVIS